LGHFLLTNLLLDVLRAAPRGRVVNVSSVAHYEATGIDWEKLRRPTADPIGRLDYCVSKLCNVLHAKELARRLHGSNVNSYSLHPGVVASDIWRRVPLPLRSVLKRPMLSIEEGARASVYCATATDVSNETGLYYEACRPKRPSPLAEDADLALAL